jgi:XTP/dITP diphosphohydrolase
MIKELVVATHNPDKLQEILDILRPLPLRIISAGALGLSPPVEDGFTLQENACIKARITSEQTGLPNIADDTGLMVDALGGMPGVFSSRFAGPNATYAENRKKLLDLLSGSLQRNARFMTCIALWIPGQSPRIFIGKVEGWITREERGSGGFGYDPIFLYPPLGATFSELPIWVKNRISHRARALHALLDFFLNHLHST